MRLPGYCSNMNYTIAMLVNVNKSISMLSIPYSL